MTLTEDRPLAPPTRAPRALEGRDILLRAVRPDDYPFLYSWETGSPAAPKWRLRGRTPPFDEWLQGTAHNTLVQFMVMQRAPEPAPVGIVYAYDASMQDGHAYVAVARFAPEREGLSTTLMTAAGLFFQYVFACWPLRKLYMDVAEFNYDQFASGAGRFFEEEGRLREHLFLDGRLWDQLTLALYRESWFEPPIQQLIARWY